MTRTAFEPDPAATLETVFVEALPDDPPSSAWRLVAAPADEDVGFGEGFADEDWPGQWGAARLGIP